ncbi:hypothetical protein MXB_27, partial [Myxobolus squamalis]
CNHPFFLRDVFVLAKRTYFDKNEKLARIPLRKKFFSYDGRSSMLFKDLTGIFLLALFIPSLYSEEKLAEEFLNILIVIHSHLYDDIDYI